MNIIGFTSKATNADVHAVLMGKMGFSYKTIANRTGLTLAQVKRRLSQTGSLVGVYRRGESELSHNVIAATQTETKALLEGIRSQMKKLLHG